MGRAAQSAEGRRGWQGWRRGSAGDPGAAARTARSLHRGRALAAELHLEGPRDAPARRRGQAHPAVDAEGLPLRCRILAIATDRGGHRDRPGDPRGSLPPRWAAALPWPRPRRRRGPRWSPRGPGSARRRSWPAAASWPPAPPSARPRRPFALRRGRDGRRDCRPPRRPGRSRTARRRASGDDSSARAGPRASYPTRASERRVDQRARASPVATFAGSGQIRVLPGEPHGLLAGLVEDGLVPVEVGHLEAAAGRPAACRASPRARGCAGRPGRSRTRPGSGP